MEFIIKWLSFIYQWFNIELHWSCIFLIRNVNLVLIFWPSHMLTSHYTTANIYVSLQEVICVVWLITHEVVCAHVQPCKKERKYKQCDIKWHTVFSDWQHKSLQTSRWSIYLESNNNITWQICVCVCVFTCIM